MKYILLLLYIITSTVNSNAQSYYHVFGDRSFGGNKKDDLVNSIWDGDGHIILAGQSLTNINGDKTDPLCTTVSKSDIWVVKIDTAFNLIWNKSIGGSNNEILPFVSYTNSGYIISCSSYSDSSCEKLESLRYYDDYWICSTDTSGNKLWDRTYGGDNRDDYTHTTQLSSGNLVVVGISRSDSGYDKTVSNYGLGDFWAVKMDQSGNKMWDKVYGGSGEEVNGTYYNGISTIPTDSDTFIIAGATNSPLSGNISYPSFSQGQTNDIWIIKVDSAGNKIWDRRYGGGSGENSCSQIIETTDGYMVVGTTNALQGGSVSQPPIGDYDVWILKLDKQGNKIWDKRYGGTGADYGASIAQAANGDFWVGATTFSQQLTQGPYGISDYWVFKIDSMGNQLWDRRFGGSPNTNAILYNLLLLPDSSIFLCGYADTGSSAVKTSYGHGDYDYWVLHFIYTINNPTGIDAINNDALFTVSPNPTKDIVKIESPTEKIKQIELINIVGEIIYRQKENNVNSTQINLQTQPPGFYFVRITGERNTVTKRVVKN